MPRDVHAWRFDHGEFLGCLAQNPLCRGCKLDAVQIEKDDIYAVHVDRFRRPGLGRHFRFRRHFLGRFFLHGLGRDSLFQLGDGLHEALFTGGNILELEVFFLLLHPAIKLDLGIGGVAGIVFPAALVQCNHQAPTGFTQITLFVHGQFAVLDTFRFHGRILRGHGCLDGAIGEAI